MKAKSNEVKLTRHKAIGDFQGNNLMKVEHYTIHKQFNLNT